MNKYVIYILSFFIVSHAFAENPRESSFPGGYLSLGLQIGKTKDKIENLSEGVDILSDPKGPVTLVDEITNKRITLYHNHPLDCIVVWTEPPRKMVCSWLATRMASNHSITLIQAGLFLLLHR